MTWETAADCDYQTWRKLKKLQEQSTRRVFRRRIDYYPSKEALAVIRQRIKTGHPDTLTAAIDALILDKLPE